MGTGDRRQTGGTGTLLRRSSCCSTGMAAPVWPSWHCAIATRADIERPKPHPDVYLEAARRLGVEPARCLAFEDSNIGIAAAHAAGMMAFMVPDILAPTDDSRARAIGVLPDLHAAVALLREHL